MQCFFNFFNVKNAVKLLYHFAGFNGKIIVETCIFYAGNRAGFNSTANASGAFGFVINGASNSNSFGEKKWGAISGILNNLMGTYSRDIPPDDLKKLCVLGQKLGLDTLADIDRAYAEYDNLLRNSDQIGKVLVDASDKLRSITQGNENFIERHKKAYEEFTELASKYGLW